MSSIEIELWNIYTYYTLHGNPRDPAHIQVLCLLTLLFSGAELNMRNFAQEHQASQFLRLCKDCSLTNPTMTEAPITQAEVHLVYHAQLRKQNAKKGRQAPTDKIIFPEFLTCLLRVAEKVYPSAQTPDDALQQLLMENVLPLASRRHPEHVDVYLNSPEIVSLREYFEHALLELFRFYATASDDKPGKNPTPQPNTTMNLSSVGASRSELHGTKSQLSNRLANAVGYSEYMRFAHDFGLNVSLGLTTIDIGDIYLSTVANAEAVATMRKLSFDDFWECLVRLGIAAPGDISIPVASKVKGVLLLMWRHIQNSIPEVINGQMKGTGQSTYKGGLLRGSQLLNEKFILQWQDDGFQDYLGPPAAEAKPEAMDVLRRLARRSTDDATTEEDDFILTDAGVTILLDIPDDADLGDSRISARRLKKLLKLRPDLASMLWACMREEGLVDEPNS